MYIYFAKQGDETLQITSKPKRVLHTFKIMNRGGAETLIMNIYRHINREEVQFDFAVHSDITGHYDDEIRSLGGRILRLPDPKKDIKAYTRSLQKILRNHGPFMGVHSHLLFFNGAVLYIANREGIPIRIAHSHNTKDGYALNLKRKTYHYIMRKLIHSNATHMLGCSREACEYLFGKKCWDDNRVKILKNAIDLKPYEQTNLISKEEIRKSLSLPIDVPIIGHVGRFHHQKNHRFIIDIFERIKRKLPDAQLVLVGDGPEKEAIEALVQKKNLEEQVHFLGIRSDVPLIINAFDTFLFPSLYEGLGIVVIEAQAAGLTCVCSDTVPREVDVGLGLTKFLNLNQPLDVWVTTILENLYNKKYDWETRRKTLKKKGYDVKDVTEQMEVIYVKMGEW